MEGYDEPIELPPGFRFHPTDEELITHYLCGKVADRAFTSAAVGEVDLTKVEPWDLPSRAKMEGKEWYFFCVKDRKYPTGSRANRATVAGYWKATGKDKEIFQGKKALVGMKKTLVFYKGRAPSGMKTNWVIHEYRLEGNYKSLRKPSTAEWVICRVFNKSAEGRKVGDDADLPSLMEISCDDQNLGISRGGVSRALEDRPGEKWIDEFTSKDPVLMPDQSSVLHHLLEMEDVKPNGRPEFIQDPYNELKNFENLEFPMVAATAPPIDLDCLWYY